MSGERYRLTWASSFSSVGSNSVCIELFVNTGYFINVFFVYKLNRRRRVLKHRLCKHGFCSVLVGKEQTYNWLLVYFNLCFGLLPPVLKKINNSSKLFYTLGLLRNSAIGPNKYRDSSRYLVRFFIFGSI